MNAFDLNYPLSHPIARSIQDLLQKQAKTKSTGNGNELIVALTTGLVELEKRVVYLETMLRALSQGVNANADLAKAVREMFPDLPEGDDRQTS